MRSRLDTITTLLMQQAGTATGAPAPAADVNATTARPEPAMEWPEGELPEQMGGARTTLVPGIYVFKLPDTLPQLWKEVPIKDNRQFLGNGQANPTFGQLVMRQQLKLDRNAPLVVVGGSHDGEPMTATITTNPRPRGKKDDPKTPWISDAAYLFAIALGDKRKITDPKQLVAAINEYAGKTIRLETGLTAQCRVDKVRYVQIEVDGQLQNMLDPAGIKGCGSRYYTTDFKNPDAGQLDAAGKAVPPFDLEIPCKCTEQPTPDQQAQGAVPLTGTSAVVLRGFEQIERYLPPLGK